MIGRLTGKLLEKQAPDLVLDVSGVGYEVQAPMSTVYQLPEVGSNVSLFTHMVVREDAQLLYGFFSRDERSLFRTLIKVNGVGPKLALTILSGIDIADFVRCVHDNDTVSLVKLPGVGKKTAERLIVEMRDRVQDWQPQLVAVAPAAGSLAVSNEQPWIAEAESALQALGYKPQEAAKAVAKVMSDDMQSSEALIRAALKSMVG